VIKEEMTDKENAMKRRHNGPYSSLPARRLRETMATHIYVLPNLLTTANMFFGFFSVVYAIKGDFITAAYAIVIAAVFDLLDGRVARLTRSTSEFGAQYDSMSDLISFCLAPGILLFLWSLQPFGRVGWLASFFYVVCGALRLARFNVAQSLAHDGPKSDFQGLPTPMAAGIVASSVLAFHDLEKDAERSIWILAITFLLGFVMVSTFRYRSFKDLDLRRRLPLYSLVIGVLIMIVVAINPEVMLFVLFLTYAVLGAVFGVLRLGRPIHGEVESESDLDQDTPPEPGSREHH
jgi:CDP-diacylglycerol--serine O-phosphatidyltransferase